MKTATEVKEEQAKLKQAALPLIKLLAENYHPHHQIIVTSTGYQLWEGKMSDMTIADFIKD